MRNEHFIMVSFLMLVFYTLVTRLVTMQTHLIHAQGNLSQVLDQTSNQTSNQTGNLSLLHAILGQQGATPPKMDLVNDV